MFRQGLDLMLQQQCLQMQELLLLLLLPLWLPWVQGAVPTRHSRGACLRKNTKSQRGLLDFQMPSSWAWATSSFTACWSGEQPCTI
jgi:hypothetical protein